MKIVILNGYPESGKDEFIGIASSIYDIYHHSTIDICKDIAIGCGWNEVKDDESRAMLSNLKKWYTKHFDGPFRDFKDVVNRLDVDVLFVVSREPEEICRMKQWCIDNECECIYIFMHRGNERNDYKNDSDNNVLSGIEPDIHFNNDGDINKLERDVAICLRSI